MSISTTERFVTETTRPSFITVNDQYTVDIAAEGVPSTGDERTLSFPLVKDGKPVIWSELGSYQAYTLLLEDALKAFAMEVAAERLLRTEREATSLERISAALAGVDAALASATIESSQRAGTNAVLRAEDFDDVHAAVRAAIEANGVMSGFDHRICNLRAEHGIHGTWLEDDASFEGDGDFTTVVVSIRSEHAIDSRKQIPVISQLEGAVREVESKSFFFSRVIFIIEKPTLDAQ